MSGSAKKVSYRVTFDDGEVEWLSTDTLPEVGDVYEVEATVERTIVHVDEPVADTEE